MDVARRELELCATSEAVDSYGTIFDYDASKDAFSRWIGNVREMHERKAVGQRVAVRCDDAARKVYVTIRISRGAQDTWEKVLDGTLRGASIGAANVNWQPMLWPVGEGKRTVEVAKGYDLVELSLVDNPSNPDALGFTFVRDAMPDLGMLDRLDLSPSPPNPLTPFPRKEGGTRRRGEPEQGRGLARGNAEVAEEKQRAQSGSPVAQKAEAAPSEEYRAEAEGTRVPVSNQASERLHGAARAVLAGCGCALCEAAQAALADELDVAEADESPEAEMGEARVSRLREAAFTRALGASLRVSMRESMRRMDSLDTGMREVQRAVREDADALSATRAEVSQVASQVARAVSDEMGRLAELGARVERLEAQPLPGGPAARPVEKAHPLHGRDAGGAERVSTQEQYRALESLAGRLNDPQAQLAVAAELIRMQREGI